MIESENSKSAAVLKPSAARLTPVANGISVLTLGFLVAPLLFYASIGFFTRYMADDYTIAVNMKNHGFWGAQAFWYQAWSGRFTFTFLASLVELAGVRIVPLLPVTALLLWGIGLYWVLSQVLNKARISYPRAVRLGLTCLILLVTLRSQPSIFQVLFWQTGILTYVLPVICTVFAVGWFLWRFQPEKPDRLGFMQVIGFAVWAFILGGISETSLFLQIGVLATVMIWLFFRPGVPFQRSMLVALLVGFISSIAALWVVASSPGNAIRSPGFPLQMGLVELAVGSLKTTGAFLLQWFTKYLRMVACAFGFPALLIMGYPVVKADIPTRRILQSLLLITLMVFLMIWITFAPAYYVLRAWPPDRALVLSLFPLTLWAVYTGYSLGLLVRRLLLPFVNPTFFRLATLCILVFLIVIGPLHAAMNLATMVPGAREYAAQWDARDLYIRTEAANGKLDIEVLKIRDLSKLGDLFPEADFWINQLVAEYYGVKSIVATEESPGVP